ncbi:MAG TPA: hypothetical protein VNA69_02900 [Thermoanaerobaculia bacterium]|nr:hypothetical protein [Thermoanaerobaculia bacterium]
MRIQETDRILKESRVARHGAAQEHREQGVLARVWQKLSSLFGRT